MAVPPCCYVAPTAAGTESARAAAHHARTTRDLTTVRPSVGRDRSPRHARCVRSHLRVAAPQQASSSERRAIYDAFVAFQAPGRGILTAHVEAPEPLARIGARGAELAACNPMFAFPVSVQVSAQWSSDDAGRRGITTARRMSG